MIDFQLELKDKITGIYEAIEGEVTPLTTEELLDEALDQAFLVLTNSNIEIIEPTTEVRVIISQTGKASVEKYYIVGDDESNEIPIGTGFYTHNLTLLERTKLLEGILCQSLAFTNALGKSWKASVDNPVDAYDNSNLESLNSGFFGLTKKVRNKISNYIQPLYKTPIQGNTTTVINIKTVADTIKNFVNDGFWYYGASVVSNKNVLTIIADGNVSSQTYEATASDVTVNFTDTLSIRYDLYITYYRFVDEEEVLDFYVEYKISNSTSKSEYPVKPWAITSAINRILDLAEPLFYSPVAGETTPRFTLNPLQADKWENEPIPDTTITQCTLREQLQHIGNYVHAQARLGGYYNDTYQENMIFFDEYGQEEQSTLQGKPYVANVIKHSINEYNTQIDTNAENIVNTLDYAQGVVVSPFEGGFKSLRTETPNLRLSESNSMIETESPIYDIISVKCTAYDPDDGSVIVVNNESEFEIKDYIFEENVYNNLTSFDGAYPKTKEYALFYTQGHKNIKGLFAKATKLEGEIISEYLVAFSIVNILNAVAPGHNWKNYTTNNFPYLSFQVSYIPFYDTKYSHTDGYILGQERYQPFTKIYNQSENVIETRFYGENIKGVADRLGNKEATRTYFLDDINKVPKTGSKLNNYYISNVVTEYMPQSIRCTVGLTEKFNRLSQNVGINSTKRVYEVSNTQAYNRNILLKEYICIGDNTSLPFKDSIWQKKRQIPNAPEGQTRNVLSTMQTLRGTRPVADGYTENLNTVAIVEFLSKQLNVLSCVKLPVVSSAFGNVMTFSFDTKDNYSVGTEVNELSNGFWQSDVPGWGVYGKAYYTNFQLANSILLNNGLDSAKTCETESYYYEKSTISTYNNGNQLITSITPYTLRKDSREIPRFNLAIEYVTNRRDLILGSALASCNPWVSNSKKDEIGECIAPKVYFFNQKINKYAKTIESNAIVHSFKINGIAGEDFQEQYGINFLSLDFPNNVDFDSWAIAYEPTQKAMIVYNEDTGENEEITIYEGGEILIACNNGSDYYREKNNYTEKLYVKAYSDKLKEYESV